MPTTYKNMDFTQQCMSHIGILSGEFRPFLFIRTTQRGTVWAGKITKETIVNQARESHEPDGLPTMD